MGGPKCPEFPPFHFLLNSICENHFEKLSARHELTQEEKDTLSADELTHAMKRRRNKMLANMMKFFGNLFLRKLLDWRDINHMIDKLIGAHHLMTAPQEHMVVGACELLQVIGHTIDTSDNSNRSMQEFVARLTDLQRVKDDRGNEVFSERIKFQIQDLLDLRRGGWQKKMCKDAPDEARRVQVAEDKKKVRSGAEARSYAAVAGVRLTHINVNARRTPVRPPWR